MRALWLPAVLRSAGLTVHEQPGWQTRGSDSFDPYGVIIHATAGKLSIESDIRVILTGSTTAPPPISQLFLARTGEWWVIASGKCNHALTGTGGNMAGYGNSKLIGIEAANDNRGEPWPTVQYESYVRGVAAICAYVDAGASKRYWTTARVSGHKEHQPRQKSDPTFDMNAFRRDVDAALTGTSTPLGEDMGWEHVTAIQGGATPGGEQALNPGVPTWARGFGQYNIKRVVDMLTVSAQREQDMLAAVTGLSGLLAAGGGDVDTAAVVAALKAHIDQRSADVAGQLAELDAELSATRDRLAKALAPE